MKKNFLKKLSFVLASAMVVSVVAPAASAFAATSVKLNATKKYLHLDVEDLNEYDFNIKGKQTGWKYLWESSNEDVVVVNEKNGVATATGVGSAKVSVVITDKKGKEVDELKATVVVRDNIKEVTIANKPEGDKLAIGAKFDFNRNFVTNSGSTKKTSAVTRWTVEPATGATIDNSGVFVATKAGEYTVTARSFQSTAKFNEWKANPAAKANLVLDDASYKLTVAASIKEVAQVDKDTIKVTFDSAVADVEKNITVSQLLNDTKIKQLVSKVTMSNENTVATIDLFLPLKAEATYVVDFTDMEAKTVKVATTKVEDVAAIKITTTQVTVGVEKAIDVVILNKDGVNITTPELLGRVTIAGANELGTYFNTTDKKLTIFTKGSTATLTATYHTYKYNSLGQEEGTLQAVATIVAVDADATNVGGLKAYTILDGTATPNFSDVKQVIAAEETGKRLFVQLETVTGTTKGTTDSHAHGGHFQYTSSDETVLIVDSLGNLYPNKQGTAVIVVSYGTDASKAKTPVGTISITVAPKRAASKFNLDTTSFSLSNASTFADSKKVTLTVLDQMDRAIQANYKIEKLSGASDLITTGNGTTGTNGKAEFVFNSSTMTEGSYTYKVTVGNMAQVIVINVLKPDAATASYYKLQVNSSFDTKIKSDALTHAAAIELIGYAPNGVKVSKVDLTNTTDAFRVEVDVPSNAPAAFAKNTNVNGSFALTTVDGGITKKAATGSYKVTAFETKTSVVNNVTVSKEVAIDYVNFTVVDSQVAATVSKVKSQGFTNAVTGLGETDATLIAAVNETLEFSVGSTVQSNVTKVKASGTNDSIYVLSVVVEETIGTAKIEHTVNVGTLIKKK